ncbi:MAG: LacI family DNA-binding transcriptional regulator [Candidatus Omnitrophica bacterium]|nr:LacI family DNA-binding transcriptional regulator [Candidatus Omnitrophota bacterium]
MSSSNKITIKEVAKRAGVSIATVSRYLNNPSSLKDENRRKVDRVAREVNYQPLMYARRLAGGKLNTFGLIIPGYEDIFYSFYALEIIRGVGMALDKEELDLHLHIFSGKDTFKTSLVDGAIFADIIGNDAQLQRLSKEEFPLVVINRKLDDPAISCVSINNFKGAYDATEFLTHHGHKRIAHLAGDVRVQCANERLEGYKAALKKNGLEVKSEYIKFTKFSRKEARDTLEELFALKNPPTAVLCCSDEVASEALAYSEEKRINVPKDLSVIGFDDNPHCLYGSLMLTTVRQPIMKMASLGVEILRDTLKKKLPPQKIVLETELIVRDTVNFL